MKRILVLGGGKQGRVIAQELAHDHRVTLADLNPPDLPGILSLQTDLSEPSAIVSLMREHDMAVGALPAALGFEAAKAAIRAQRHYVDLAFYPEDAYQLDEEAKAAGIAILPDCGLAPGISNLVAGRAQAKQKRQAIHIQVGGVAKDKNRPYGYVVTWAPTDLLDEFHRPARIRRNNRVETLPAMSEMETIRIDGVGEFEAFLTDGCRTLLQLDVPEITEKTMRWPGHIDSIRPLLQQGTLIDELKRQCSEGEDMVVFRVQADDEVVTMVDQAQNGLSAMARTTALTCAAFTRWVASGRLTMTGVIAPEQLGADEEAYRFILKALLKHDIRLQPQFPFL